MIKAYLWIQNEVYPLEFPRRYAKFSNSNCFIQEISSLFSPKRQAFPLPPQVPAFLLSGISTNRCRVCSQRAEDSSMRTLKSAWATSAFVKKDKLSTTESSVIVQPARLRQGALKASLGYITRLYLQNWTTRVRREDQQFKAHILILQRIQIQFSTPMSCSSQQPLTPAPGHLMSTSGLCGHYIQSSAQTHRQTHA